MIGDRFLALGNGRALDLATGRLMTVLVTATEGPACEIAWSEQRAALLRCRHPALAPLTDFGCCGDGSHRFEAYDVADTAAPSDGRKASEAADSLGRFLEAGGLRAAAVTTVRAVEKRPVSGSIGLTLQRVAVMDAIVEMVNDTRSGHPCTIGIHGPTGSGVSTALGLLAREVRLHGFVPVSTVAIARILQGWPVSYAQFLQGLLGRHVVILDDGSGGAAVGERERSEALARLLMDLGSHDTRPHRVITGSRGNAEKGLSVGPFDPETLRRMVWLEDWPRRQAEGAVERALKAAEGRPGRFMAALSAMLEAPPASNTRVFASGGSVMVHESPQSYGVDIDQRRADQASWKNCLSTRRPHGEPYGVDAYRQKARVAWELLRQGKHARGERAMRDALGGLIRREDHGAAALAALVLGQLAWQKGRTREATSFVATSRLQFELSSMTAGIVRASVYAGLTATDEGRLMEAEAELRSALVAAGHLAEDDTEMMAALALTRCLIWQARYDEADRQLQAVGTPCDRGARGESAMDLDADLMSEPLFEASPATTRECLFTEIRLGQGDLPGAGRHASAALDVAAGRGSPIDRCAALGANAAVQARVGDVAALREHVGRGLSAARQARLPLKAIELRLYLVEGLHRAGRSGECRTLAMKLARVQPGSLPPVLRTRFSFLKARTMSLPGSATSSALAATAEAFAHSTGARHLLIDRAEQARASNPPDVLQEIVEILQMCHDVDDERAMLTSLCGRLRERVRAVAVGFWTTREGAVSPMICTSARAATSAIVERALASGLAVGPAASSGGTEAAVPVRYGGAVIAVLSGRWHPDPPIDAGKSMLILRAAAASAAPAVQGLLDRTAVSTVTAGAALEGDLLGVSESIESVRRALGRAARAPFPVLVEGESGTGKELAARGIHRLGPRRDRKFCAVNCAALNDELIEAELFGHARGAFTGAVHERAGLFEEADGGTLFLDEVGELSMRAQVKILRALQESEIRRVGESFHRRVDVRLVAATNRALDAEVASGRFRQDLLYRIDVIRIRMPPLRERIEDIPLLARHFWSQAVQRTGSRATLGPMAVAALAQYGWPGNVRELQNVMSALAVAAPARGSIGASHLPGTIGRAATSGSVGTLDEARRLFERRYVEAALARVGGHRGRAALDLGLSRQGLTKLLSRLGIAAEDGPPATAATR